MVDVSRPNVPVVHTDAVEHRRQIATTLNEVLLGRLNNTGIVTLATGAATTVVDDRKVAVTSVILLSPTTAAAAAEVASGNLYITNVTAGQFTVAHTNSATADRTFGYAILG